MVQDIKLSVTFWRLYYYLNKVYIIEQKKKMYSCCEESMDEGSTLACGHCGGVFHHSCINPTCNEDVSSIATDNWICPTCAANRPKTVRGDNTPIRSVAQKPTSNDNITQRPKKKNTIPEPSKKATSSDRSTDITLSKAELREIIRQEMSEMKKSLEAGFKDLLNAKFRKIEEEFKEMKKAVSFVNNKYEEIKKQLSDQDKSIKSMSIIAADVSELQTSLDKLETENNARDQWARRSNIEICGIPERKNENLIRTIDDLAKQAEIPFNAGTDMDFVTRVASLTKDNKKPKRIIVRFMSRYYKDEFLAKVRKLKNLRACDIGFSGNNSMVFFNDHLTNSNKLLLQKAKAKAKDTNYKFVWVKNCTIMVRQNESSPVIHINSTNDLFKIK